MGRVGEVTEGPVDDQEDQEVEEDMADLAVEGTGDPAAQVEEVEGTPAAAAEEGEEVMEAAESRARSGGRERTWSFLVRGLAEGLVESHPGVIGKMTVREDRAGWRIAEAADSPVLEEASQAGGVQQVEVRAILCLAGAAVTEGQAPVEDMEGPVEAQVGQEASQVEEEMEDMEAPVEMAMEAQAGQADFQVVEEMEDMEAPVEDLVVKCRCSNVQWSMSSSVKMSLVSSVKQ